MSSDRPAELSPWAGVGWPVLLSPRGAYMCRVALEELLDKRQKRHGGAAPSDEVGWLLDVLRLGEGGPGVPPQAAGTAVRVTFQAAEADPADAQGSAGGSAVAGGGEAGRRSARKGPGESFGTRAAAKRLGISDRMVRRACVHGWLPAVRVRGAWSIGADALGAYAERREARRGGHQQQEGGSASPPG